MILYNTLMGVCAGGGMLLVAQLLRIMSKGETIRASAGPALLVLGIPLTILAGAMTLTWPLNVNPPINIAFGEPALMLGLLLTVAGAVLCRYAMAGGSTQYKLDLSSSTPVLWVIFFVGLILAAISSAILSYDLVGDAPPQEPITGNFTGWENTFFGYIYALAALGCLLAPWLKSRIYWVNTIVVISWQLSGVAFLAFSVLNYRTHIGLLINIQRGTDYNW